MTTIIKKTALILAVATGMFSCAAPEQKVAEKSAFTPVAEKIDTAAFQKTIDGKQVGLYTLTGANGIAMKVTNYGARVVALCVPGKTGELVDVVLGYNTLDEYISNKENYFGAAIGRVGNRIANAKFLLDSIEYTLTKSEDDKQLHGGMKGFHQRVWDAKQTGPATIEFSYLSVDGEEGYPGNLQVTMTYELTAENGFKVTYAATTDKATVCNLTHHSYFNLSGDGAETINDHVLMINADSLTPVDSILIPTGELMPVAGTPFDFNTPTAIGDRVNTQGDRQLQYGFGYDHNWVLNRTGEGLELAATVYSPVTGIKLDILTDQPGLQFYGGNFLDSSLTGKSGKAYKYRSAMCLETQHFPDAPNQATFPSTTLRPGEKYAHVCVYSFSVQQ